MRNNTDTRGRLNETFLDIAPSPTYSESGKAKIFDFPASFVAEARQRVHTPVLANETEVVVCHVASFPFFFFFISTWNDSMSARNSCGRGDKCKEKAISVSQPLVSPNIVEMLSQN